MRSHLDGNNSIQLGRLLSHGRSFDIELSDLQRHLFMVGQTGSGKSTLLKNLAAQIIASGGGTSLIDPHGDLSEELLRLIPRSRFDDVVYLDAADESFVVALDWFGRSLPKNRREPIASALVAAFRGYFGESWGPRLEMILSASLLALLECDGESLMGLPRMLEDERYRARILTRVKNPMVRSFFENQMGRWDKRQHAEFVGPVLNKVSRLFLNRSMRGLFGQTRAKVNVRFMMDDRRILIANLAKGKIGEDSAALFGSMLVALFEQSAMSRADISEHDRVPHILMVDEYHNFASLRLVNAFSEIRKFGLSIVAVGQYLQQSAPEIRNAIFGNCGTIITFRTGAEDAEVLRKHLANEEQSLDWFKDLSNFEAIVRRMTRIEDPFKIKTHAALYTDRHDGVVLKQLSREKYASDRQQLEERIERWLRH